jgi:hypothetical protein
MSTLVARSGAVIIILLVAFAGACATVARSGAIAARAFTDADSTATTAVARGVTYTFVRDARGPWAIHLLEIDARQCEPVLRAAKGGDVLRDRALTSTITADAIAGINADFFMLPGGTPVGAHVTGSVPLIGPTDRPVFAAISGDWRIGRARIRGHAHDGSDSVIVAQVNRPATPFSAYRGTTSGVTLFTALIGDSVPADTAARSLTLRVLDGNEAAGRGVVVSSDSAASIRIRSGTAVVLAHGRPAHDWARRRAPGDTISWNVQVIVDGPVADTPNVDTHADEVVGGFPELLRAGRAMLGEQNVVASFGASRHPRTALGWTPDGRLLLVVVDGRQPEYSAGMSLDELTWLFQRLGASDALNLDGGGSSAMVVDGAVVNRPSDREGERAVGNALALVACR